MGEEDKGIPLKKRGICLHCGRLTMIYLGSCLCVSCAGDIETGQTQPARVGKNEYGRTEA